MSTDGRAQNERLLTLEFSDEVDLFGGEVRSRIFLRLYAVAMRESGLFRALPDPLFKLLCVLASYANVDGVAWPSQKTLGRDLGCSRQAAGRRIKALSRFQFGGKPLVLVRRLIRSEKGLLGNLSYQILPFSGIKFGHGRPTPGAYMRGQEGISELREGCGPNRNHDTSRLHGAGGTEFRGSDIHSPVRPCNTGPYMGRCGTKNNQPEEEFIKERYEVMHRRDAERSIPIPNDELERKRREFIRTHRM